MNIQPGLHRAYKAYSVMYHYASAQIGLKTVILSVWVLLTSAFSCSNPPATTEHHVWLRRTMAVTVGPPTCFLWLATLASLCPPPENCLRLISYTSRQSRDALSTSMPNLVDGCDWLLNTGKCGPIGWCTGGDVLNLSQSKPFWWGSRNISLQIIILMSDRN